MEDRLRAIAEPTEADSEAIALGERAWEFCAELSLFAIIAEIVEASLAADCFTEIVISVIAAAIELASELANSDDPVCM